MNVSHLFALTGSGAPGVPCRKAHDSAMRRHSENFLIFQCFCTAAKTDLQIFPYVSE